MDITALSLTELKAMVYDEMAKVELSQRNMQILNAEIAKRNAPETESPK